MDPLPAREVRERAGAAAPPPAADPRAADPDARPAPLLAGAEPAPLLADADVERIEEALRQDLEALRRAGEEAERARPAATRPALDALDEFFWREDEEAPGLLGLADPTPPAPEREPAEVRREWLTFRLGEEEFALDIAFVREILKPPEITEVPRAPGHVLGIIMVRGEVVAIFDPRRRLGLPPGAPGPKARVVVCDAGDGPRGLLVDSVSHVVRLGPSDVEARPSGIGGPAAELITGIGRDRGRLYVLLDAAGVLGDAPPARPHAEAR